MLQLAVVDIKGNTGKCESACQKNESEGFLDSASNKTKAQFLEVLS